MFLLFAFILIVGYGRGQEGGYPPEVVFLKTINHIESPLLDDVFKGLSHSVNVSLGIIPLSYALDFAKTKKFDFREFAFVMGSPLVAAGITSIIKEVVRRDRPYIKYDFIQKKGSGGGFSFPSGHTAFAFSLATSLTIKKPGWRTALPMFVWASGVAISRMYLGVHYPTDIYGGILVGISSSILLYHIIYERYGGGR